MKIPSLAVGLSLTFAAGAAEASVLFDTVTGIPQDGVNTLQFVDGGSPLGDSFAVSALSRLGSVSLSLGANSPGDGGFILVYLVPDAGGLPSHLGNTTTLTNRTLIGTVLDSTLTVPVTRTTALPTLTLSTAIVVTPGSYWIELVDSLDIANGGDGTASSGVWGVNADNFGIGTSGQLYSFNNGADGLAAAPDSFGPYRMAVAATVSDVATVPEPVSFAIVGAGLAGMALTRRRRIGSADAGESRGGGLY